MELVIRTVVYSCSPMEEGYRPDDDFSTDSSFDDDIDNISLLPDTKRKPEKLRRRKIHLFRDRSFGFNGRMCSKTVVYTSITAVLLLSVVVISVFVKPSLSEEFDETIPEKRSSNDKGPVIPPEDISEKYVDKRGEKFVWKEIRLPSNLVPEKYLVQLHPNLKTFKFKGSVEMLVKCNKKTNSVIFHAKHMDLTKIKLYKVNGEAKKLGPSLTLGKIAESSKLEMYSVEVPEGLEPEQRYIIYVEFNSSLTDKLYGFYKSSYKNKNGETR